MVGRLAKAAMERQIMRGAIRSVVGSMAAVAVTLSASAAMACSSESGHSTRARSAATRISAIPATESVGASTAISAGRAAEGIAA